MEFVMSKWAIALTVATLACGSASAYLWQELRHEREQTAALQTQIVDLKRAVSAPTHATRPSFTPQPVEATPPSLTVEHAPAKPKAAAARLATSPAPMFTANGVAMGGGRMDPQMRRRIQESHEQQARMLKDPDYRELMHSQQKMSMQRMYGDLEPLMGLSKEESERLLDILADQAIRVMEQPPMLPPTDGEPPDQNAVLEQQRRFQEQRRVTEAEIAAALGPKYNQWQEYQNNGWARSQVMQLRQTLSGTDEPIRLDQVKPLVEAIAREQPQMNRDLQALQTQAVQGRAFDAQSQVRMAEEWLERTAQSQQRIRDAVTGLLTPTQSEQLQRQHDQNLKMQELNLKQQRARAEAQARGELPPDPAMGSVNIVTSYSE
jgi:hypothetical protein